VSPCPLCDSRLNRCPDTGARRIKTVVKVSLTSLGLRVGFNSSTRRQPRAGLGRTVRETQLRLARLEFQCRATITAVRRASKVSTKRPPVHHQDDGPERPGSACRTSRQLLVTSQRYAENSDSVTISLQCAERGNSIGCHDFENPPRNPANTLPGILRVPVVAASPPWVESRRFERQRSMTSAKTGSSSSSIIN